MVRRGFTCSALRIRMTSMATTVPAPLSVAPVADDPRIEMASDHHHFVFQFGIGAGNFGDGVEAVFMVAEKL
jgi:hypothetical protein